MTPKKKNRVLVYIDGFNLYFGMTEAGYLQCKWLDINKLIKYFLKPDQEVVKVKFFTSRISQNPQKQKRQTIYLEAIETSGVEIIYGFYQTNNVECEKCGHIRYVPNEKMTDVNIATHLLIDAFHDEYDTAILISGDTDLVPPIKMIHENFPTKSVFVFFPPKRHNVALAAVAKGSLIIGRKRLVDSQFPDQVVKKDGFVLIKPIEWK